MRMIKLIILFLALMGGECDRSQILPETTNLHRKLESLMESAVLSLLSCYEKKVDTVGGIGITHPTLIDILMKKQPHPVKLFGSESEKRAAPPTSTYLAPHKLHLFVAETSPDAQQFEQNRLRALSSQPAAHLATFLIIEWPSQKNPTGCSEAINYLWQAWAYETVNAFSVCVDKLEKRVFVYAYNPYTSQAPAPWTPNKTFTGFYNHPWTLFVREYRPGNQEICNNLDFVKTHDLGGYTVRCFLHTGLPFSQLTPQYDIGWDRFLNHAIVRLELEALNATSDVFLVGTEGNNLVAGNFKKNFEKISEEKFQNYADIYLTFLPSMFWENRRISIPFTQSDYVVATHHSGEKSQLDKLIGVFDRATRFGICLVIIMTVLFFYFCTDQSLGRAMMNVIRIIGYTGLRRVPNGNAPRLYLAGIFILVVTIIGVYQGLLASLLTKPILLPEIDTLEDLANSDHKIYVPHSGFIKFFKDPKFKGRLASDYQKCDIERNVLLIRPSEACVLLRQNSAKHAIEKNLHITREPIIPAYVAYHIKQNWAVEKRFNEILRSFHESRILSPYDRETERRIKIAEYKESVERDRPVVMTLSNLGFAFAFLGIGLSLATIVLVIEIAMKRRQLGRRKTRLAKQRRVINVKEKENIIPIVACVPGPSSVP